MHTLGINLGLCKCMSQGLGINTPGKELSDETQRATDGEKNKGFNALIEGIKIQSCSVVS